MNYRLFLNLTNAFLLNILNIPTHRLLNIQKYNALEHFHHFRHKSIWAQTVLLGSLMRHEEISQCPVHGQGPRRDPSFLLTTQLRPLESIISRMLRELCYTNWTPISCAIMRSGEVRIKMGEKALRSSRKSTASNNCWEAGIF